MTRCNFFQDLVPDPLYRHMAIAPPHASPVIRIRCQTHNFDMSSILSVTQSLCPIGQIEEATEQALAKIKEAKDAH